MYEVPKHARGLLRGGAAFLLALLLCAGAPAKAAEVKGVFSDETARMLVPVGHTVGIKLFSRGVVVVKLTDGGTPARTCGLRTGDVIEECGGAAVTSTEQFQALLQENGESETDLQVRRNGGSMTLSVAPSRNDQGVYCIGAWIRDSMAGIGTMTFYDPATGVFGALGHGITDTDTALLMPFSNGSVLPSTVKAVKRRAPGGFRPYPGPGPAVRQHQRRHLRHSGYGGPEGRRGNTRRTAQNRTRGDPLQRPGGPGGGV